MSMALIVYIAALSMSVGRPVAPQQTAAVPDQIQSIFKASCIGCHGPDLQSKGLRLDSMAAILKGGESGPSIILGQAEKSLLFKKVVGKGVTLMPPGGPQLPPDKLEAIRAWIASTGSAAKPNNSPTVVRPVPPIRPVRPPRERPFYSDEQVFQTILSDLKRVPADDQVFTRYFTLSNIRNTSDSDEDVELFVNGLSKLVNSLSWKRQIVKPIRVNGDATVLRIDIRNYDWKNDTWQDILSAYPYGVQSPSVAAREICQLTDCELPFIRADWFVAHAALPPLYHQILDLPKSLGELERRLDVDVERNITERHVVRAGMLQSGVSRNNRIVERHRTAYGAYWRSYDFASNTGKQNIFKNPLDFNAAGGEVIFNLPNGLQAYMLADGKGNRLDTGPTNIVDNGKNPNRKPNDSIEVRNGLTCMSCHSEGMRSDFKDRMRSVLSATKASDADYDYDLALAIYVDEPVIAQFLTEDKTRFKQATELCGASVSGVEPIFALQGIYDNIVSVRQAASDLGLTRESFLRQAAGNTKLSALLGDLLHENGQIKRDSWEEYFGDTVTELKLGRFIEPSPQDNVATASSTNAAFSGAVARLRSDLGSNRTRALCAYLESMRSIPAGKVGDNSIQSFALGQTPVPWAVWDEYLAIVGGSANKPEGDSSSKPVVNVSIQECEAFCAWLSKATGIKFRLPTTPEFRYAASDGGKDIVFPWGNTFDNSKLWCSAVERRTESASIKRRKNIFTNSLGLSDMAGNVYQWCVDIVGENRFLNIKGGSWSIGSDTQKGFRCDEQSGLYQPNHKYFDWGFRLAADIH